jgi:hypothetical protein
MVPNVNYLKFKVAKKDKQKFTRTIFHEHVLKKKCYDQHVDFDSIGKIGGTYLRKMYIILTLFQNI